MAENIYSVLKYGHPALYNPSSPVEDVSSAVIQEIIHRMTLTVNHYQSAGLAAPQVGLPLAIALYKVPQYTDNPKYALTPEYDPDGVPLTALINPRITPLGEEMREAWEGCLSLPGMLGKVPRYHSIQCEYLSVYGEQKRIEAHGFHARVLQHECDHLEGILYPLKLKDIKSFGYQDEILSSGQFLL